MTLGQPESRQVSWWGVLWQPFWVLPAVIAAASLALGVALPALEASLGNPFPWVFHGGTDGARSVLGTIAGAMISVTGLVFSITMVILQLASSQFTPRILGTFLESRVTQVTLGVFAGSFLYALTVLRTVRTGSSTVVPETAVAVSYLYVVGAVGMFLAFIQHITASVQVSKVMTRVQRRTLRTIRHLHADPDDGGASVGPHRQGWSPRPDTPRATLRFDDRCGYVTIIDSSLLVGRAAELDAVVELELELGDYLAPHQVIGRVWGLDDLDEDQRASLAETVQVGPERDQLADVGFGVRQLLDIAERALSPGVNDPTTAIQSIHQLHVVLRALAVRPDLSPYLVDEDGTVRATYRPQTYALLLRRMVTELLHYGTDTVRVLGDLERVLAELTEAALPVHAATTGSILEKVREHTATAADDRS